MGMNFDGAMLRAFLSFAVGAAAYVALLSGCVEGAVQLLPGVKADVQGDLNKIADKTLDKLGQQATGSGDISDETRKKIKDDFRDAAKDLASGSSTTTIIVQQPVERIVSFKAIGPQVWTGDMLVKTPTDSFKIQGAEPLAFASTDDALVVAASVSSAVRGFKLTEIASGDDTIQEWAELLPFTPGSSLSSDQFDRVFNPGKGTRDMVDWNEANKTFEVNQDGKTIKINLSVTWAPSGIAKDEAANHFVLFDEDAVLAFRDGKKWWYAVAPIADVTTDRERIRWPLTPIADGLGSTRYMRRIGRWLYTHAWDEDLKKFVLWRVDKKELKRQLK